MHKRIYTVDEKFSREKYNRNRDDLDSRITSIIDTMENKWLSYAKCLLFGRPVNDKLVDQVENAVASLASMFFKSDENFQSSGRKLLLTRCLEAMDHLSLGQFDKCLLHCLQYDEERLPRLSEEIQKFFPRSEGDMISDSQKDGQSRHPVILILDREVQSLPWEAMR